MGPGAVCVKGGSRTPPGGGGGRRPASAWTEVQPIRPNAEYSGVGAVLPPAKPAAKEAPMKVVWIHVASASGSIAGATASRAKGGVDYLRARVTPTNPNTARQQVVRSALSALSSAWRNTLTPTERGSWITLADGSPQNGLALFNKGNVSRRQAGMTDVLEYDATLAEPEFGPDGATNSGSAVSVTWTANGSESVDGAALLLYIQQPTRPSVTNNNRYRFLGSVQGDSGSAPTSPFTGASPWGNQYQTGDTSIVRGVWVDPSGRLIAAGEATLTWA